MKRSAMAVSALLSLLGFLAPPLHADDMTAAAKAPTTQEGAEPKLRGEYLIMANVLKYTPEQRTKLADAVAAKAAANQKWETVDRPRGEQIFKERRAAQNANDTDKADALTKQIQQINAQHGREMAAADKAISDIMTPEQVKVWDIYTLHRQMVSSFTRADLTDAQKAEVHKRVDAVSEDFLKADKQGRYKIHQALMDGITKDVLTDAQREAMQEHGMPGMRGHRGAASRPAGN